MSRRAKAALVAVAMTMIIGANAKPIDHAANVSDVHGRGVSATKPASFSTCTDELAQPTILVLSNSGGSTIVPAAYTPVSYTQHTHSETPAVAMTSTVVSVSIPSDVSTPVAFTDTSSVVSKSSSSIGIVVSTTSVAFSEGVSVPSLSSTVPSTVAVYDTGSIAITGPTVTVTSSEGVLVPASSSLAALSLVSSTTVSPLTVGPIFYAPNSTEETTTITSTTTAIPLPSMSSTVVFASAPFASSSKIISSTEGVISASSLTLSVPATKSTSAPSTATVASSTQSSPMEASTPAGPTPSSYISSAVPSTPAGYVGSSVVTPQSSSVPSAYSGQYTPSPVASASSASEIDTFYGTTITGTTTVTPVHPTTQTKKTTLIVSLSSGYSVQSTDSVGDNSGGSSSIRAGAYSSFGVPSASISAQTLTTKSTAIITESITGTVTRTLKLNSSYGAPAVTPSGPAYTTLGAKAACDCSAIVTVYATITPSAPALEGSIAFTSRASSASKSAYGHLASSSSVIPGTTTSVEENSGVSATSSPAAYDASTSCAGSLVGSSVSNDYDVPATNQPGGPLSPVYSTPTPSAIAISNNSAISSSIALPPMGFIGVSLCGHHVLPISVLGGTTFMTTISGSLCPSPSIAPPSASNGAPISYVSYESVNTALAPYPTVIATALVPQSLTPNSATPSPSFGGYNSSVPSYGLPPTNPSGIVTVPASSGSAAGVQLAFLVGFVVLAILV